MMLHQNSDASGVSVQSHLSKFNQQPTRYYESFFQKEIQNVREHQNYLQKLTRDSKIAYVPESLYPQLKISVLSHSLNFKVIILRAQLNHFQFEVSILNEEVNSRAHLFQKREYKYADIYWTVDQKPDFVVKCFRLKPEEDALSQFCTVLRQFCYYRIAAELNIGPPIAHPFGFDLQVTNECIEFALEKYEPIEKSKDKFNFNLQKNQRELRQKLFRLHSLHIVHKNIHPFNILYSTSKKQFYLSDFGFCCQVLQPVSIQTKTAFSGALNYCHEQMMHVFGKRADSADLYLNDVYSLRESFSYLKKSWSMQQKYKNQGRKVRVMELRDIYEDYGGLYNNLGSFYQKLDSVYQYAFSYYSLLKSYLAVHQQDQSIISNPRFIKICQKFPLKIFQILKDYEPCEFTKSLLQGLPSYLQKVTFSQSDLEEVAQINNPFRKKLLQRKANIMKETDAVDVSEFSQRLKGGISQLFVLQGGQHIRKAKIERKIVVNNPLLAMKLDRLTYYKQFLKFVEIRQIRSTYEEKIKACEGFLKVMKIGLKQNLNLVSQHPELQKCLKHILYQLINSPDLNSQGLIADTLTNLIISDTISEIDLFSVLEQLQQRKKEPLKEAVMLFNIYCGVDWIRFKSLNIFQQKKVFQIVKANIQKAIIQLLHLEPDNFCLNLIGRLILTLLAADQQRIYITKVLKQIIVEQILYLEKQQAIDQLTANQMISLTCLSAATTQGYKEQDIQDAIKEVYMLRPKLSLDNRIESFHLRMYALFDRLQSDNIYVLSIKNRFWRTLQVPKMLNKYKLFFSEERSKYNSEQIPRLVKSLEKLCEAKKYKFCKDMILEWKYWLHWIVKVKDEQLYDHYIIRLKELYTNEELYNMDFPSISADNDFFSFYQHAFELITFYLTLHRKQQRQPANIVNNFLDQLESHYDAINFEGSIEIKKVVVHFISFIKLEKYILQDNRQQANYIVKEAVKSLTEESSIPWSYARVYLLQYLEYLLKWAFLCRNNQSKQRSFQRVFYLMSRFDLIPQIFNHNNARKLMLFLNQYSLALDHGAVNVFLNVHRQLLAAIEKDPIRPYIRSYIQSCDELAEGVLKAEKAIDVIQSIIRHRVEKIYFDPAMDEETEKLLLSNYDCLLLSSLLRYSSHRTSFPEEISKHISLRIEMLVPQARKIVLERLFTYQLVSLIDSQNKPDKRFIRRSWFEARRYVRYVESKDSIRTLTAKHKELKPFKKKQFDAMFSRLREYKKKWADNLQKEDDEEELQEIDQEETTQEGPSDS